MRIKSVGGGEITFADLSPDEQEKIEGAIKGGMWWIRGVEGKLVASPNFKQLPDPIEDEGMLPFWRKVTMTEKAKGNLELFDLDKVDGCFSPSIVVKSLCGYYYTPEKYQIQANLLRNYGFECMRSMRGDDGKYLESWYLPGLWAAKGALKDSMSEKDIPDNKKLNLALEFLRYNTVFGTLDVTVQRLAMCSPD